MRFGIVLAALVVAFSPFLALAAPDEGEPSALEAALEGPKTVTIGHGLFLGVKVRNPTSVSLRLEGAHPRWQSWSPSPRSRIAITLPGGSRRFIVSGTSATETAIAPGNELSLSVRADEYMPFDMAGDYSISLTLVDSTGARLKTNFVDLEVTAPTPTGDLLLSLTLTALESYGTSGRVRGEFTAGFVNAGETPLAVITPQDGSEAGLLEPHYWLDIRDAEGRLAKRARRFCGNASASYDERTVIELEPGARTTTAVSVYGLEPGHYTARLHYIVKERPEERYVNNGDPGHVVYPRTPPPPHRDEIYLGWARSDVVTFEVPTPTAGVEGGH